MECFIGLGLTIIGTMIWNHYAKITREKGEIPSYKGYMLYIWYQIKKP